MTTPHDATAFSNPAQSSPAETAAQNAAVTDAAKISYQRSIESTVSQYEGLTGVIPEPHIKELTPNTAAHGAGTVSVTIIGLHFTDDSVVKWDGSNIATTFVSDNELTVTPNKKGSAGAVNVLVDNGSSTVSNTVQFTFS